MKSSGTKIPISQRAVAVHRIFPGNNLPVDPAKRNPLHKEKPTRKI